MLRKLLSAILLLSFCFTVYFTWEIISAINYVPTWFYTSVVIFIMILVALYSENSNDNKTIKIMYNDFKSEFDDLHNSATKRFDEYISTNNISELKKLKEEVKHYQYMFTYLISSHTHQFSASEILQGVSGEQADINKLLVQEKYRFFQIDMSISSYFNTINEKYDY